MPDFFKAQSFRYMQDWLIPLDLPYRFSILMLSKMGNNKIVRCNHHFSLSVFHVDHSISPSFFRALVEGLVSEGRIKEIIQFNFKDNSRKHDRNIYRSVNLTKIDTMASSDPPKDQFTSFTFTSWPINDPPKNTRSPHELSLYERSIIFHKVPITSGAIGYLPPSPVNIMNVNFINA